MPKKYQMAFIMVLICLTIGASVSLGSPFSSSLSMQDWAYSAIEDLGRGRNIPGFNVPSELNRNQGALLVARLLQHLSGEDHLESRRFGVSKNVYLDNMIFSYNEQVKPEQSLSTNQVESLYRLVLEFREELEVLGYAVQDFNLLYAQGWVKEQDGLFGNRSLLYSEQALAAARKLEEESRILSTSAPEEPAEGLPITEILPAPIEPRSLWTGQLSSTTHYLPPPSSLVAPEPAPDQSTPLQVGGLEVRGALRPGQPLDDSSAADAVAGYGISVKMGDLALKTAVDVAVDQQLIPKVASTSVDLSLDWSDLFTISAGYKKQDSLDQDGSLPTAASLGVVVPITSGKIHLGVTQEWKFNWQGGNPSGGDELPKGTKNTAELGLSYDFKNDSSLRFNYRFIDFGNVEQNLNNQDYGAEAAFSIKF